MAIVRLLNGKTMAVPPEKALALWQVFSGEEQGSVKQQEFCSGVSRIYLNWNKAPMSYKLKYPRTNGQVLPSYYHK